MKRNRASWGFEHSTPREMREAELFYFELMGLPLPWPGARESAESNPPPEWLPGVVKLPVTYATQQMPMASPPLGIVLHTTNHGAGEETLERFQRDWPGSVGQSAHFVIDRAGRIGQYRSTKETAWHIGSPSPKYFGIEHISKHKQELTQEQLDKSAYLVGTLCTYFNLPQVRLPPKTATGPRIGIGIHTDFDPTGCGEDVFWTSKKDKQTKIDQIIMAARSWVQ